MTVLRAQNLPPADTKMGLQMWGSSDPYTMLYVLDRNSSRHSGKRRTTIKEKTLNPVWKEDFYFSLPSRPVGLALVCEVWDHDDGKSQSEHDFIGIAELELDEDLLRQAERSRQLRDLDLQSDHRNTMSGNSVAIASGKISLQILWESNSVIPVGPMTRAWKSPIVSRFLGMVTLSTSFILLLIAGSARSLCQGASLRDCHAVTVPGAGTADVLGALLAVTAFVAHTVGSLGLCGAAWDASAPTLTELTDVKDLEENEFDLDSARPDSGSIQIRLQPISAMEYQTSLKLNLFPEIPMPVIRLIVWLLHLGALACTSLAAFLAELERGQASVVLGEAFYMEFAALGCLIVSAKLIQREKALIEKGDPWRSIPEHVRDLKRSATKSPQGFSSIKKAAERFHQNAQEMMQQGVMVAGSAFPLQPVNVGDQAQLLKDRLADFFQDPGRALTPGDQSGKAALMQRLLGEESGTSTNWLPSTGRTGLTIPGMARVAAERRDSVPTSAPDGAVSRELSLPVEFGRDTLDQHRRVAEGCGVLSCWGQKATSSDTL